MDSYIWMFEAMGRLHATLAAHGMDIPAPLVATWSPPSELLRRLTTTAASVADDDDAAALASWARELTTLLAAHWIAEEQLPNQVIHGDVRLANVARTRDGRAAYFDFGFAAVRPRVFDLAYALSWIVLTPDDNGRADDFDWTIVADLVGAYEAGAGLTLTVDERHAIVPYLASVPLHLASIASDTPDPQARIKLERPFLAIADWLLHHPSVVA
jgi:Ser/Thr protein kinase RdoA (MazF antagonist)